MGLSSPDTGLGFSTINAAESAALFANVPWLFWLHNVGVTLMTVLASEPRAGRFQFVSALLSGSVPRLDVAPRGVVDRDHRRYLRSAGSVFDRAPIASSSSWQ